MKILVTGSTGFIGRHLVKRFLDEGHSVTGTYRKGLHDEVEGCRYINIDLSKDTLRDEYYDCIFHAAGQVQNGKTWDYIQNSIFTTKAVIDYCEKNNIPRMVFFSSIAVYGECDGIVNEKTTGKNLNTYAECKLLGEKLLKESSIPYKTVIRLSRIVGEGGFETGGFLTSFSEKMLKNEDVVYSNGEMPYNNVMHISDLENLCDKILGQEDGYMCVGTGADDPISMKDMIETLKKELGSNSDLVERKNTSEERLTCHLIDISVMKALGIKPESVTETMSLLASDAKKRF